MAEMIVEHNEIHEIEKKNNLQNMPIRHQSNYYSQPLIIGISLQFQTRSVIIRHHIDTHRFSRTPKCMGIGMFE